MEPGPHALASVAVDEQAEGFAVFERRAILEGTATLAPLRPGPGAPPEVADAEVAGPWSLVARIVADRLPPERPGVVGVTGPVAAGKSTTAALLASLLGPRRRVAVVATDGFLAPNAELEARGLADRKGFPETYRWDELARTVAAIRDGRPTEVPRYDHGRYDVGGPVRLEPADVVVLEGLHLLADRPAPGSRVVPRTLVDVGVYVHAPEEVVVGWYVDRLLELHRAAVDDPTSFYHRFRDLSPGEMAAFARSVWDAINGPNVRRHIDPTRRHADVVIHKDPDHRIIRLAVRS